MRDYLQRAAIRAPNRIRVKKKDPAGRQGREVHGAGDGTRTREMKAWEAFALPLGHARVGEHYTPSAPISLVY